MQYLFVPFFEKESPDSITTYNGSNWGITNTTNDSMSPCIIRLNELEGRKKIWEKYVESFSRRGPSATIYVIVITPIPNYRFY
jgi:hypothetical protein